MAHNSLEDSLLTINLSWEQYDTLLENSTKANALTQVILAHTIDTLDNIPAKALYYFFWVLDDLLDQINESCHTLKPQPPHFRQAPVTAQTQGESNHGL